jgi:hypothetical protein
LENEYKKVLQDNNIQLHNTRVMALCPKGYGDLLQGALVIFSNNLNTSNWKEAAIKIQKLINQAIVKVNGDLDIQVEIRNKELMYQDIHHVIRPSAVEQKTCREIEDVVFEQVKRSCQGKWPSICYFIQGTRDQTEGLKLTLVVGIGIHKGIWSTVEEKIEGALQSFKSTDVNIYIELLPSRIDSLGIV